MSNVQVDIVTPEHIVYEGEVKMVIARGVEGELGVMPGHTPLVTPLKIGVLRLLKDGGEQLIAISGGFLEVRPDKVTVLAETAELPEDIDLERAKAAQETAQQRLETIEKTDRDYKITKLALERATNRINVAQKAKS